MIGERCEQALAGLARRAVSPLPVRDVASAVPKESVTRSYGTVTSQR